MTTLDALHEAIDSLKAVGIETAVTDAEWLLEDIVSQARHQLYLQNRLLTDEEKTHYRALIKRRCNHEPVAYIIGHKTFLDWEFVVSSQVLIPRWETELLVNELCKHSHPYWRVGIDIGTGSGAIAISLARMLPHIQVYATDISESAIQVAWLNAQRLDVSDRITFIQGDMFSVLDGLELEGRVNFIVSNPPYITTKEMDALPPDVRDFEPRTALDGGEDGLDYYRKIIKDAPDYLVPKGYLALEVGPGQAKAVEELMQECFFETQIINDLCQRQRVVFGQI
ncbi:peptide chain release factor N(5)-glutamine methyltransferase [bacterium]|nr:peptide chain release factor N(5)-glutamine methyltransferase [bacterium]MBU1752915.1 peptide chain release factor N(5)-glutamine methyltransferase [bacterium]